MTNSPLDYSTINIHNNTFNYDLGTIYATEPFSFCDIYVSGSSNNLYNFFLIRNIFKTSFDYSYTTSYPTGPFSHNAVRIKIDIPGNIGYTSYIANNTEYVEAPEIIPYNFFSTNSGTVIRNNLLQGDLPMTLHLLAV